MNVRPATSSDVTAIREIAEQSLRASYNDLDDDVIETAVQQWYGDDAMNERLDEADLHFLVAEEDEVVGFSQSHVWGADGRIQWLHVHPDHRGEGFGTGLLDATRNTLASAGVERITGAVLATNEAGNEFYREHGFTIDDQRTIEVAGEFHAENVYADVAGETAELEAVEAPEGELFVDRSDPSRGKLGPFYPVYRSHDGSDRYGWFCSNCKTVDNSQDTMGRIVCNVCDNVHKADRWDAAYL